MIPINNMSALFDLVDSMRQTIKEGVDAGLKDAEEGRVHVLTNEYIKNLSKMAHERIDSKQQSI